MVLYVFIALLPLYTASVYLYLNAASVYNLYITVPYVLVYMLLACSGVYSYVTRILLIERFPYECRKVIGFAFTTLRWPKKFAPLFHPIRSKTKTNCVIASRALPSATCNYFEF